MIENFEAVIIESPYAGDVGTNERYARAAMRNCLKLHNESPFVSHLLYTQDGVLDDTDEEEREIGITAGFTWREFACRTVVYFDLGMTSGMLYGIIDSIERGKKIEYRSLADWRLPGTPRGVNPTPSGWLDVEDMMMLVQHAYSLRNETIDEVEFDRFIEPFDRKIEALEQDET